MTTNFPQRSSTLTFIFPGKALALMFTCSFNRNGHQSTDIQGYNERQSIKKNELLAIQKLLWLFYIFEILERKNLNKSKMIKHEKCMRKCVPNKHTEKSQNFS